MKVWIDQDLCIGNGICEELCADLFIVRNGKAYVVADGVLLPSGPQGCAPVPAGLEGATLDAAEACPVECIFVEMA
jgi:ferredoxin